MSYGIVGIGRQGICTLNMSTQTQGPVTNAPRLSVYYCVPSAGPTQSVFSTDYLTYRIQLPKSGSFRIYLQTVNAAHTGVLTNSAGASILNVGSSQTNALIPETSGVGGSIYTLALTGIGAGVGSVTNTFILGLNAIQTLSGIANALMLEGDETFTVNATNIVYQLNRIFTSGSQLSLVQFAITTAGSYQVTSSNPYIIPNGLSTSFLANQNITEVVTVLNSSTTEIPVTLTISFPTAATEQPFTIQGYIM
jgi:hypothetical protein